MNDSEEHLAQGHKQQSKLADVLQKEKGKLPFKPKLRLLILVLVASALALFLVGQKPEEQAYTFETELATIENFIVRVSATGNIKPTNQVDVGSELSGIIEYVFVQENDIVQRGQKLAKLDTIKLEEAVKQSKAILLEREATVEQRQATLSEAKIKLYRLRQLREITDGKLPSKTDIDTAVANMRRAKANISIAEAGVSQAKAKLSSDENNLEKATLASPIDGVVLKRSIDAGQTVAASFQAPVLFTIAEDLSKMELHVDVDEADVGKIKAGQDASFSVDAWPNREYNATISRVSLAAEIKDGIVTYPTVLKINNEDLSLRPGMTGTAQVTTLSLEKQLLVPNEAFRVDLTQEVETHNKPKGVFGFLFPRSKKIKKNTRVQDASGTSKLWILVDGDPSEIEVRVIASNQSHSAVNSNHLSEGQEIIIKAKSPAD